MKRRIAWNALGRVVLSSTLGLVTFVGCGPSLDPLVVAGRLAAASRQTFTQELASTGSLRCSPGHFLGPLLGDLCTEPVSQPQ